MSKLSPLIWFQQFQTVIKQAQCRIQGENQSLELGFKKLSALLQETKQQQSQVWWVGNGGSSAICSHLSQDLVNKLQVRSMVINDPALLTCMANDYGYEQVYAQPLKTLAQKGDLLIAISSSGQSDNILNAVDIAQQKGLNVVSLSAFDKNNALWNTQCDLNFYLNCQLYGHAEIGHELLLHSVIECLVSDIKK